MVPSRANTKGHAPPPSPLPPRQTSPPVARHHAVATRQPQYSTPIDTGARDDARSREHTTIPATILDRYRERADAASPQHGTLQGLALASISTSTISYKDKRRAQRIPAKVSHDDVERLKRPDTATVLYDELDADARRTAENETVVFQRLLTPEERSTFQRRHRLSPQQRDHLLSQYTKQELEDNGLRFSDQDSPFRDDAQHARRRAHASVPYGSHPVPDPTLLLTELWHYADPLLLELTADAWVHGVNVGFHGPFETAEATNMTSNLREQQQLVDLWIEEIRGGRSKGFFSEPPFIHYHLIPAGFVLKKDETKRPVDNFSKHNDNSVNARSDRVRTFTPPFSGAVRHLHDAGLDGRLLSWDKEKAYQTLRIRECDQWLTVARFPIAALRHRPVEFGELQRRHNLLQPGVPMGKFFYAYRTHCPFGLAASGYRWDVCGGKAHNTLYQVMQHRIRVNETGTVTLRPQRRYRQVHQLGTDDIPQTLTAAQDTYRVCLAQASDDTLLHPLGRTRLQALRPQTPPRQGVCLDNVARNVDDFMLGFTDIGLAQRTAAAIVYIHARLNSRLKHKKFTSPARACDFNGFDLVVPYTVTYQRTKQDKLSATLRALRHETVQWCKLESAIGQLIFLALLHQQVRGTLSPLYARLLAATKAGTRRRRAQVTMGTEALRSIGFLLRVVKEGPRAVSSFMSCMSTPGSATIVAHTDWAAHRVSDDKHGWGAVCLSELTYWMMPVPELFVAAWGSSSPTMEAFAVYAFLLSLGDKCRHSVILVFVDNLPFLQAYERCYSGTISSSPGLATALRAIAFFLISHSAVLFVEYVPTDANLADPASRGDPQALVARLSYLRSSRPFCEVEPPTVKPPAF